MSDASDRRIVQGRIKRLELLLRLSTGDRARDLRRALDDLYVQVGKAAIAPDPARLINDAPASASGVNGVGGLKFTVQAPPGTGRLVRIPFYLYELDPQPSFPAGGTPWTTVTTAGGASATSTTNPTVIACIPPTNLLGNANKVVKGMRFRTPILEWATVRIVGFQVTAACAGLPTSANLLPASPAAPNGGSSLTEVEEMSYEYTSSQRALLLVKGLSVGGSASLLPSAEYTDATVYSTLLPEFPGLRDNPILESPNRAFVTAAVTGLAYTSCSFAMYLIADVLDDSEFGTHRAGPYARRGAQVRQPSVESSAFITK